MKIKESIGDKILNGFIYFVLAALVIICVYPMWLVLVNSFSDPDMVSMGKVTFLPLGFSLDAYIETFKDSSIMTGYANSLFYTIFGTAFNMLLTIPAAYSLSKRNLKGRGVLMGLFLFTMYFSGGLIPQFVLYKSLGITNTRWVIILHGGLSVYNMIVARSFFESGVPHELEEAAEIDGCSVYQTFVKIVLPLSKAMMGVILLYYAVGRWNDFTSAMYFLPNAEELYPLQMVLRDMINRAQESQRFEGEIAAYYAQILNQIKYAVIVVASVPLLAIFPFVQKYFEKGVMLGSVKG